MRYNSTTEQALGLDFTSAWTFPAAIDHTFLVDFVAGFAARNDTTRNDGDLIKAAAAGYDIPAAMYFGSEAIVVHVGDVLELYWMPRDSKNRTVSLACLICTEGRSGGVGRVFDACIKYTNESAITPFHDVKTLSPPNYEYTLPPLYRDVEISENSVGVCFFTLFEQEHGYGTNDYTIPFGVTPEKRESNTVEHWRFSAERSNGEPDPTIGASLESKSKGGLGKGVIAGIVMGVVAGVALAALLSWLLWRRRMKPKSVGGNSDDDSRRSVGAMGSIELQNRRHVEEDEEAPPAYHEVVRTSPDGERI
ncbi:hypothetical protein P154DRAFT_525176 [Amniculicola lignicola CBS 123094]|uniref:Uncharacterized protein n=1 Tax=Amniculicola lignicola CBS 123094 TaxID=1392246 RepID=A0A6A5W565_9PLEO|nr:hypothetical protein P154DRAFT_525176 [Amniculicola lignicola CBS 123094]